MFCDHFSDKLHEEEVNVNSDFLPSPQYFKGKILIKVSQFLLHFDSRTQTPLCSLIIVPFFHKTNRVRSCQVIDHQSLIKLMEGMWKLWMMTMNIFLKKMNQTKQLNWYGVFIVTLSILLFIT